MHYAPLFFQGKLTFFIPFIQVQPAAGFASQVKARGGKVAVFNTERSNGDEEADFLFIGKCEVTLPDILDVKADIAGTWT
jgi:NAD-dependent deacetylase sirtuin 5